MKFFLSLVRLSLNYIEMSLNQQTYFFWLHCWKWSEMWYETYKIASLDRIQTWYQLNITFISNSNNYELTGENLNSWFQGLATTILIIEWNLIINYDLSIFSFWLQSLFILVLLDFGVISRKPIEKFVWVSGELSVMFFSLLCPYGT